MTLFFAITAAGTAIIMIAWAIDNAREALRRRRTQRKPPINPTVPEDIGAAMESGRERTKGRRTQRWWPWVLAGGMVLAIIGSRTDTDGLLESIEKVARDLQSLAAQLARELSEAARRAAGDGRRTDVPETAVRQTPATKPREQQGAFARCRAAKLVLRKTWAAPEVFHYFAAYPRRPHPRRPQNSLLGLHRTSAKIDVTVQTKTTCRGSRCQVCITSVLGEFGFRPSRITLREDLRANPCVQGRVLMHEQGHAAVTREAENIAISRAHHYLTWTQNHGGILVGRGDEESGKAHAYEGARYDLNRALDDARAYARKQNEFIDSDAESRREWSETRRLCGKSSWR